MILEKRVGRHDLLCGSQKHLRAQSRFFERVRYAVRAESGFTSGGMKTFFANASLRLHGMAD